MSEIRAKGKNSSDTYTIPDEHSFSGDIILEQLEILDTLFSSAKIRMSEFADVGSKMNSFGDDKSCTPTKQQKVETEVKPKCIDVQPATSSNSVTERTKVDVNLTNKQQPISRIEFKESIKRKFEDSKKQNSDPQSNVVAPISAQPITSTSSKITRDIHQYIAVVNPKGQMKMKLDQAAPYNFFLTTITDSTPTHREPLSITFQGNL